MCVRLAAEHEDAKAVAQHEFEELRALLLKHNEALMEEARTKYQEALALAQVRGKEGDWTLKKTDAMTCVRWCPAGRIRGDVHPH